MTALRRVSLAAFWPLCLLVAGCQVTVTTPTENATVMPQTPTAVAFTANAAWTLESAMIDGQDKREQFTLASGANGQVSTATFNFAEGEHTVEITANVGPFGGFPAGRTVGTAHFTVAKEVVTLAVPEFETDEVGPAYASPVDFTVSANFPWSEPELVEVIGNREIPQPGQFNRSSGTAEVSTNASIRLSPSGYVLRAKVKDSTGAAVASDTKDVIVMSGSSPHCQVPLTCELCDGPIGRQTCTVDVHAPTKACGDGTWEYRDGRQAECVASAGPPNMPVSPTVCYSGSRRMVSGTYVCVGATF